VLNLQLEHLGVETEGTYVLEMVDQRDAGAKVPLLRQDFVDVSLPNDSSLPQVGSAAVSLPRHVSELDSVSLPLPRQQPAVVSLPQQTSAWSAPPASPTQGPGRRAVEISPGLPRNSNVNRAQSPMPYMGAPAESSTQPTRGGAKKAQGTGVFLGGRYSREEVIKFGGISEQVAKSVRSSERIRAQPNADATQMERAQERAILRDFGNLKGTNLIPQFTLASIPNEVAVASASKLRVSLGKSPSQIESLIALIKNRDLELSLIMLKRKEEIGGTTDEGSSSFTLNEASRLSVDLEESDCFGGGRIWRRFL
jgi:hypothetical protein